MPMAGRAAHSQRADRFGDLVAAAADLVDHGERQHALVQQFQRLAVPADRADVVVAVVIDGGIVHARI